MRNTRFWDRGTRLQGTKAGGYLDLGSTIQAQDPGAREALAAKLRQTGDATPVDLPNHLFAPHGAQTIDWRRAKIIDPATTFDLIDVRPLDRGITGAVVRFTHYAVYTDGLDASLVSFLPLVNGVRVYGQHGDPMNNLKISLGLAPDLSDNSLIVGTLNLKPEDRIIWRVTNSSVVPVAMGVRMVGYIDYQQPQVTQRFGG